MSLLFGLVFTIGILTKLAEATPFGKLLKQCVVDRAISWLEGIKASKLLFAVVVFVAVLALVQTLPFDLALLTATDAATYIEIVATAAFLLAHVRVKAAASAVARAVSRLTSIAVAPAGLFTRRSARRVRMALRVLRAWTPSPDDEASVPAFA
jgi:hypothetical protein